MVANSLEIKINENPLTKEILLSFLKNKVANISNNNPRNSAQLTKNGDTYRIDIGFPDNRIEQELSLIHEAIHAIYDALGWVFNPDQKEIENLIEREAERFYRENEDFVSQIYSKLVDKKIKSMDL